MLHFAIILCAISSVFGTFTGPFVLWGREDLKVASVSVLGRLDDKILRNIYSEATAIIMFLRNANSTLSQENFPNFQQLIHDSEWIYLPQHWLSSDPVDYNVNAEVFNLVGATSQQDIEISAIYKDAENRYGKGKVLGILGVQSDDHDIRKREAVTEEPSTTTSSTPTDEVMEDNFIYINPGKMMMYTTSPPILTENETITELRSHGIVTDDDRGEYVRMVIVFKVNRTNELTKLVLRFKFPISNGYWSLTSVEVEDTTTKELNIVGDPPVVPIGFSYKCSSQMVFRGAGGTTLILENIQVEPKLRDRKQFNDAYDCVGFTTAPIWSGIFVASIMLGVTVLALICITEIKPPNKFESNRGKQLTFTVQE